MSRNTVGISGNPGTRQITCLAIGLATSFLTAAGPVGGTAEERMAAIAKAAPTATLIFEPKGQGGGSGVMISPEGEALTNFHVTSPCGSFMRCGMADGKIYDAVVIGVDPVGDLALIRVLSEQRLPFSQLADSNRVRVGDPCFAAGNPFLLATSLEPSVSWGIVSGTHRYQFPSGTLLEYADCLQTDAAINPGNSGGALFNAQGEVIGIVGRCSFEKRGRINVGIGYAISSNQASNFLGVLRSGRIVDHATLGATVATDGSRVHVSNILDESDAYRRGLRFGDQLDSLDGRAIRTPNDLTNILGTLPEGWRVPMVYRRNGTVFETIVRLPGIHGPGELAKKMAGALPPADEPLPRKPDGKKKAEKDKPKQPDDPERPDDDRSHDPQGKKSATENFDPRLLAMHEDRKEMANDYFNRLARQRIVESIRKFSPLNQNLKPGWKMIGRVDGPVEAPVEVMLEGDNSTLTIGEEYQGEAPLSGLYDAINQRSFGGMQAALIIWQKVATDGLKGLGESVYYGTAPLRGQRPLRDCLQLTIGELEAKLYTSVDTGRLEAIEVWADRDHDPVELYLHEAPDQPGSLAMLELVYGTDRLLQWRVNQVASTQPGVTQ